LINRRRRRRRRRRKEEEFFNHYKNDQKRHAHTLSTGDQQGARHIVPPLFPFSRTRYTKKKPSRTGQRSNTPSIMPPLLAAPNGHVAGRPRKLASLATTTTLESLSRASSFLSPFTP